MQEEVESRTVNLAISTSKLSARTIVSAVKAYLNHRKNVKVKKEHEAEIPSHGKQTVKELIGQGQGVTNIDIAKTDLRGFEKVARKYGMRSGKIPLWIRLTIWSFSRQKTRMQ